MKRLKKWTGKRIINIIQISSYFWALDETCVAPYTETHHHTKLKRTSAYLSYFGPSCALLSAFGLRKWSSSWSLSIHPQMLPAKLHYLCQEMSPISNSMESLFRLILRAVRIAHNATLPVDVAKLCPESALESFQLSGRWPSRFIMSHKISCACTPGHITVLGVSLN